MHPSFKNIGRKITKKYKVKKYDTHKLSITFPVLS